MDDDCIARESMSVLKSVPFVLLVFPYQKKKETALSPVQGTTEWHQKMLPVLDTLQIGVQRYC